MDQYSELMSRVAKLMEVWTESDPAARGVYSVGVVLGKGGQVRLPVYAVNSGEHLEDLMMGPGETRVTRCWGPAESQQELV